MDPQEKDKDPEKDPGALASHPSYTDKDFEGKNRSSHITPHSPPSNHYSSFKGHRAHAMYVGFHVPGAYRRRGHHRRHKHKNGHKKRDDGMLSSDQQDIRPGTVHQHWRDLLFLNVKLRCSCLLLFTVTPPAERVHFILGEDDQDGLHESHPLFSELEELCGDGTDQEWRETAR